MGSKGVRFLLTLVTLTGVLVLGLYYFSSITAYLVISLVLSTILRPIVNKLSSFQIYSRPFPRVLAILISFLAFISIIFTFTLLFIPLISEQIKLLKGLNFEAVYTKLLTPFNLFEKFLIRNNLTENEPGFLVERITGFVLEFSQTIDFKLLFNNLVSIMGSFLVGALAVFFITFFFLVETGLVKRMIFNLIPNAYFELSTNAINKIEKLLTNYLSGLFFQMLAIFSLASIALTLLGVKYALTIALFAAVANLIPYLGPVLGASFGVFVTLFTSAQFLELQGAFFPIVKVLIAFAIVQLTDNVVFQPFIFSKSVKAHPLEIFIIIFAGATIAGPIGMIFAIPVYTILRVSVVELIDGYRSYNIFKISNPS